MTAQLAAGYAAVDITPPVGTDLTGFIARTGPCDGTLDPLEARALVLVDGSGNQAAVVTCDLIGIGRHLVARVRRRVQERTGIAEAAQMFACSHTHAGPETGVLTTIGLPNPAYLADLEEWLVDVVSRAAGQTVPVTVRSASGQVPAGLVLNRVYRHTGSPEAYDHQMIVVRLDRAGQGALGGDGEPGTVATLVNFACHAVALGAAERHASADYVASLRRDLEAAGTGPVMYLNGCGGDVNPATMDRRGRDGTEVLGRGLAAAALPLWRSAATSDAGTGETDTDTTTPGVAAVQAQVRMPYQTPRSAAEAAELLAAGRDKLGRSEVGSPAYRGTLITDVEYPLRLLRLHYGSEALPDVEAEVQVLRLGPLALVGLPGEIFSSIGRAIKDVSPLGEECTLVAGWTNDNVGYVPDHPCYELGGYEADVASRYYGHPAPWAPAAGDRLREAATQLLATLPEHGVA